MKTEQKIDTKKPSNQRNSPIVRACMCEIHNQFKWFMTKWFQSQNDMINQQISIGFTNFVSPSNVIKNRISSTWSSGLVKNIQAFDRLELVFFMHVMLGHDFFELGTCHIHGGPPAHYYKSQIFVQKFNFDKAPTVFHPNFFWQFFSWNQSCQQLKSPKPQHFHEFFTQKIDNFHGKSKLNFWTKNEDFEQCEIGQN